MRAHYTSQSVIFRGRKTCSGTEFRKEGITSQRGEGVGVS